MYFAVYKYKVLTLVILCGDTYLGYYGCDENVIAASESLINYPDPFKFY